MEIKRMRLSDIKLAHYNPRKDLKPGDPEYEKLKRSIEEFDCVEPLVWNRRSNRLIGGHQRLKILKEKGIEEFEVSVVDLEERKEKALNVALNKIEGDWDFTKLADLMTELDDGQFDLELTGFDMSEIEEIMNWTPKEEEPFDAAAEAEKIKEPKSKRGEIYQLGRHRLMCGDATSREDVERLMDGEKADMVFTDPPYNVNYDQSKERQPRKERNKKNFFGKIKGDNLSDETFSRQLKDSLVIPGFIRKGCVYYICMGTKSICLLSQILAKGGFYFSDIIIWKKPNSVMMRQGYQRQYEMLWYGWYQSPACHQIEDRKQTDVWEIGISSDLVGKKLGSNWSRGY